MFPFIYSMMIEFEDYEENTKLILNIARIFILRMISLVFLIFTIYGQVACDYVEGCFNENNELIDKNSASCDTSKSNKAQ